MSKEKFQLGLVVTTPGASEVLPLIDITTALHRHQNGDWGDICQEDKTENIFALQQGLRIMSIYTSSNGTKFWIITEADRSVTTVLLPEDY